MGNQDKGAAPFLVQGLQKIFDFVLISGIQGRQRFIKQHPLGIADQGPGQGHPLLLPAAQGAWFPLQQMAKAHDLG